MTFFFQAEDGIRDGHVTGVQTCALPISAGEKSVTSPSCPGIPTEVARKGSRRAQRSTYSSARRSRAEAGHGCGEAGMGGSLVRAETAQRSENSHAEGEASARRAWEIGRAHV